MKLLRFGPRGTERPGIFDPAGNSAETRGASGGRRFRKGLAPPSLVRPTPGSPAACPFLPRTGRLR